MPPAQLLYGGPIKARQAALVAALGLMPERRKEERDMGEPPNDPQIMGAVQ